MVSPCDVTVSSKLNGIFQHLFNTKPDCTAFTCTIRGLRLQMRSLCRAHSSSAGERGFPEAHFVLNSLGEFEISQRQNETEVNHSLMNTTDLRVLQAQRTHNEIFAMLPYSSLEGELSILDSYLNVNSMIDSSVRPLSGVPDYIDLTQIRYELSITTDSHTHQAVYESASTKLIQAHKYFSLHF